MLYFAYGSNLNHAQMEYRCGGATFIKKYILKVTNFALATKQIELFMDMPI